jgi:hypothetical protein
MTARITFAAAAMIAAAALTTAPAQAFQTNSTQPQITSAQITQAVDTGAKAGIIEAGFKHRKFHRRGGFGFRKRFGKRFNRFGHGHRSHGTKLHKRHDGYYFDRGHKGHAKYDHGHHKGHGKTKVIIGPFGFFK